MFLLALTLSLQFSVERASRKDFVIACGRGTGPGVFLTRFFPPLLFYRVFLSLSLSFLYRLSLLSSIPARRLI